MYLSEAHLRIMIDTIPAMEWWCLADGVNLPINDGADSSSLNATRLNVRHNRASQLLNLTACHAARFFQSPAFLDREAARPIHRGGALSEAASVVRSKNARTAVRLGLHDSAGCRASAVRWTSTLPMRSRATSTTVVTSGKATFSATTYVQKEPLARAIRRFERRIPGDKDSLAEHLAFGLSNFLVDIGQGIAQVLAGVVALNLNCRNLFNRCHGFHCDTSAASRMRGLLLGCRDCR
jgi:hypothetical protein